MEDSLLLMCSYPYDILVHTRTYKQKLWEFFIKNSYSLLFTYDSTVGIHVCGQGSSKKLPFGNLQRGKNAQQVLASTPDRDSQDT